MCMPGMIAGGVRKEGERVGESYHCCKVDHVQSEPITPIVDVARAALGEPRGLTMQF